MQSTTDWYLRSPEPPPPWLVELVRSRAPGCSGKFAAQLLWQRGVRQPDVAIAFLDPDHDQPEPDNLHNETMQAAVDRLIQARDQGRQIYVIGRTSLDSLLTTALLWEGLGPYFQPGYTHFGTEMAATQFGQCPLGNQLGDSSGALLLLTTPASWGDGNATISQCRPEQVIVLQPSEGAFAPEGNASLPAVAIAYQLLVAVQDRLPDVTPTRAALGLDLVAMGLLTSGRELRGAARSLAQRGLRQLQQQLTAATRPGVAQLLQFCRDQGDRPGDRATGLSLRLAALSEHHSLQDGIELLTTVDPNRGKQLAMTVEWSAFTQKEAQQRVTRAALAQLKVMDMAELPAIILYNPQWPINVLESVAADLAQTYGRPTILFGQTSPDQPPDNPGPQPIAQGIAYPVRGLSLAPLLQEQQHLLQRVQGAGTALELSIPVANLDLFNLALNQSLRQQLGHRSFLLEVDLKVTVADLMPGTGAVLFRELQLLEPYGIRAEVPRLLLHNCAIAKPQNRRDRDPAGRAIQYLKTTAQLSDPSTPTGFPVVWWGHATRDLPTGPCDIVAELDYGKIERSDGYFLRLLAIRPATVASSTVPPLSHERWLLDQRQGQMLTVTDTEALFLRDCPVSWSQLEDWAQQAQQSDKALVLAYAPQSWLAPEQLWLRFAGMAKYMARTQVLATPAQWQQRLGLSAHTLSAGLRALEMMGYTLQHNESGIALTIPIPPAGAQRLVPTDSNPSRTTVQPLAAIQQFMHQAAEDQFQAQYFQTVPAPQLQTLLNQRRQKRPSS